MTSLMSPWPGHHTSGGKSIEISQVLRQIAGQIARFASPAQSEQVSSLLWGGTGASVTLTSPDLLTLLERCYVLEQREQVQSFLARHPQLVPLLLEAFSVIQLYFERAQVVLRPVDDPEGYTFEQLGLFILVPGDDPEKALEQLAAFDEGWWLDAMGRARGHLFITVAAA